MAMFIKMIAVLAVASIVAITSLLVLDVVTLAETKETLTKTMLVLGVVALGGLAVSFFTQSRSQ